MTVALRLARGLTTPLLVPALALGLAACDEGGFNPIPQVDSGPEPEEDAGVPPPPPVYPLKAGDLVEVPVVGARIEPCPLGEGFCDRAISASYDITDVSLDEETNTWTVEAHYFYEMQKADTSYESIQRLFYSEVAPFGDLMAAQTSEDGDATFTTRGAPTDDMRANGFPFFHFEPEYANRPDSAFAQAADAFALRIRSIDPDANIDTQAAASRIRGYFKDTLGDPTYLHKVEVTYHPMGFLCGWDELLIGWQDTFTRTQGDFAGADIPVAASFNTIRVVRDGVRFNCSCFTMKCTGTVDNQSVCLDPTDPEAPASAEACN